MGGRASVEGVLFRRRGSDSGASERSFGERGVDEGVTRIIELRISGKIIPELHPIGYEIQNPVRSGVVFDRGEIRMDGRIHGIRGTSRGIEYAPARTRSSSVLNHEVPGTEAEVQERSVGVAIADVRSEFRETRDFRPKIGDVRFSRDVVVIGLVGIENGRVGHTVETADAGGRHGSIMQPSAPRTVGVRSPRLVERLMVRRPVVVPLGVIVAVEVLRKVHRRFRTERMGNLTRVRPVPGIRDDVESRKRPFFPVPSNESPSRLIDVHVRRKPVRIERGYRRSGRFSKGGIRFQDFVRSPYRIDKPIGIDRVTRLSPDQIRPKSESSDGLRGAVSGIRHDVEKLRGIGDRRSRKVRRGERLEPRRCRVFEIASGILIERGSRYSALSEVERFGLGSIRTGIRGPRICSRQRVHRIGSGSRIAVEGS